MTGYDKYVLVLCLIVFALLATVFIGMLTIMAKQGFRLIAVGAEDERIYKEYLKKKKQKGSAGWLSVVFTAFFAYIVVVVFLFTLYVKLGEHNDSGKMSTIRVVYSDSMSRKYEKNTYLFENNLNDQFSRFDVVITRPLPAEEDLKLYDIVVYEVDNTLLIHRIVGIEEPNEKHPDERHFLLQGDLVERADKFPVRYDQMRGIYRGERIPYVGSFIMFLQSPAGYICFILVIIETIASPMLGKKIEKAEENRLQIIKQNRREQGLDEDDLGEDEQAE